MQQMKKKVKVYRGVRRERITVVEKQNKRTVKSQSASYRRMEFWKNVDVWQSVALYVGMIVLFYCFGMLAGLI